MFLPHINTLWNVPTSKCKLFNHLTKRVLKRVKENHVQKIELPRITFCQNLWKDSKEIGKNLFEI
jgi:hypothetical protein